MAVKRFKQRATGLVASVIVPLANAIPALSAPPKASANPHHSTGQSAVSAETTKDAIVPYRYRLVVKTGDVVDGRKIKSFQDHIQLNDKGDVLYLTDTDHGRTVFLNDKIVVGAGQTIDGQAVYSINSFFLFQNGDVDVAVMLIGSGGVPDRSLTLRNNQIIFDTKQPYHGQRVESFSGQFISRGYGYLEGASDAYYVGVTTRDNQEEPHVYTLQNSTIEVAQMPDGKPIPDLPGTKGCISNEHHQHLCHKLVPGSGYDSVVRDDGKEMAFGGSETYQLNNNGKILVYQRGNVLPKTNRMSITRVLDYTKDIETDHAQAVRPSYTDHRLDIPYAQLLGKTPDCSNRSHNYFCDDISAHVFTDGGKIALTVINPFDQAQYMLLVASPGQQEARTSPPVAKPAPCARFQTMLTESKDIQKLADTLARDDKAYLNAVIDIIIKGYNSPYAVYMLDVPSEEIPEYFKDEQQINAVRSQIIARIRKKAENRKRFADIGIKGNFMPQPPTDSRENIELFCTLDSSKFTKEFWDSLWMAGYIDYPLFTQVEDKFIKETPHPLSEILIDIGLAIFPLKIRLLPLVRANALKCVKRRLDKKC